MTDRRLALKAVAFALANAFIFAPVRASAFQEPVGTPEVSSTVEAVDAVEPTVLALEGELLEEQVDELRLKNQRGFHNWLRDNAIALVSALGPVVVGVFAIYRYFKDRADARDKDALEQRRRLEDRQAERDRLAEDRFQHVVEGLGSDRPSHRAAAAVTLRTFLSPEHERFHIQVFDLAVAMLRLRNEPVLPVHTRDPNAIDLSKLERPTADEMAIDQALANALRESLPLARRQLDTREQQPDAHQIRMSFCSFASRRSESSYLELLKSGPMRLDRC